MMATRSRSTRVSSKASVVDHQSPTVVVAGAGIVGSSTAYFLAAEQSLRPVLLDASYPAASASGKAGGFLAETWSDGSPTQELARRGFALHKEWSETVGIEFDRSAPGRPNSLTRASRSFARSSRM